MQSSKQLQRLAERTILTYENVYSNANMKFMFPMHAILGS